MVDPLDYEGQLITRRKDLELEVPEPVSTARCHGGCGHVIDQCGHVITVWGHVIDE